MPSTAPLGRVNQKDTASPGVNPRARNIKVLPGRPLLGVDSPFLLPDVSQVPLAAAVGVDAAPVVTLK